MGREVGGGRRGIRRGEIINLLGRHVTDFLTKSCMVAYEWYCMTMCACIVLIVNLRSE